MEKIMRSFTFLLALLVPSLALAEKKETRKALNEFFEAEWNYEMEKSPARASSMADRRWNDRWGSKPEGDPQTRRTCHRRARTFEEVRSGAAFPGRSTDYDLFQKNLEMDIEGFKFRSYLMPINQRGGIQTLDEL